MKYDELKLEKFTGSDGRDYARIIINGRELIDLVKEIELPIAEKNGNPESAGVYSYLPAEVLFEPSFHLYRKQSPKYDYNKIKYYNSKSEDKLPILESPDNDGRDWALFVYIRMHSSDIEWVNFEKVYKEQTKADPDLQYKGLGPFVFDRNNYWDEKVKYFNNVENKNLVNLLYYHKDDEIRTALRALQQLRYYEDSGEDSFFCSYENIPGTEPYFYHLQDVDIDTCNLADVIGRFPYKEQNDDDEYSKIINQTLKGQIYFFEIGFTLSRYYLSVQITSGYPGAGEGATYNFDIKKNGDFVFTGKNVKVMF